MTDIKELALRVEEEYFKARPQIDCGDRKKCSSLQSA
jgi:hypothetical protein